MTDVTDAPETFVAFAARLGKSRPYVSKLVATGIITSEALTQDRLIVPSMALRDIDAARDPARRAAPPSAHHDLGEATYARQRARKTAAEAERAEIELRARKGELIEREAIAATLAPAIRELRDSLRAAPRDTVLDPVQAADCEAAIDAVLTEFAARYAAPETHIHEGPRTEQ
jgi:hypothetical protein